MEREIVLPTTIDEVWEHVVDPAALGEWLGGEVTMDGVAGGRLQFIEPSGARRVGVVERVDAFEHITWTWCDPERVDEPVTTVDIELVPDGTETILRVTELPISFDPAGLPQARACV